MLESEIMSKLRNIKSLLIDLSGTLHIEDTSTHNAIKGLELIEKAGISTKFVTNTTKESQNYLFQRLTRIGFQIKKDDIFSSLTATRKYIQSKDLRPYFLMEDVAMEEFEDLNFTSTNYNAVVVGLAPSKFDYHHLNEAFRILLEGDSQLIACHKGKYFKTKTGNSLGPGPFVQALEYSTGKVSTVIGKPNKDFYMAALKELGSVPGETAMIGDDLMDDVIGAQNSGILGILVRTGKYRTEDDSKIQDLKELCFDNFYQVCTAILTAKGISINVD